MHYTRPCSIILSLSLSLWIVTAAAPSSLAQSSANPAPAAAQQARMYSAQGSPAPEAGQSATPVSYASVTQINGMLSQLETSSKSAQADLAKLRIDRWKADAGFKKQSLSNVDSIQRNLQGALPEIMTQVKNAPEDLPASFKLYRNLDALYDVMGSVVESAGAFGSKDDFQSLSNDLSGFENTRKQLAERIETLASAKENEISHLRTDLKAAQAAIPAEPPKKIVVDDTEPPKKPVVKKKPLTKKPAATTTPAGQTPGGQPQPQSPPQQQPQKPQ